ncbi:MAG: iron-containing alcohol dehydrogenase [Acidobacteria bacterium]|nr:iron-containing alcohol dehydrogenase [Acidobacteriota bacterium]
MPTTLSGGEFGFSAGCTDSARRIKQSYRHPLFVPQVVVLDPADLDARLKCQLGVWASMEHNQDGTPMGASHGIGHVLGGTCGVPHGHTSCVMLPAVLDWNAEANPEAQARVSEALGRPGEPASRVVDELVRDLGLPRTLTEVGVSRDQFDVVARNAMHDRCIHTNPRTIHSPDDVLEILELAA